MINTLGVIWTAVILFIHFKKLSYSENHYWNSNISTDKVLFCQKGQNGISTTMEDAMIHLIWHPVSIIKFNAGRAEWKPENNLDRAHTFSHFPCQTALLSEVQLLRVGSLVNVDQATKQAGLSGRILPTGVDIFLPTQPVILSYTFYDLPLNMALDRYWTFAWISLTW